ncbi:hypothetical protein [Mycobacteroides abscessus]|uniref:hypothetical protein n=1 Tax=Mycobacteroides abscessus TaxID=36809 RepID=UPI0009A5E309|nr:hypothetical protein [Mycobacteroides abscessus]SKK38881.1 Uncharacterised protein [Mycobacteroides abscessus subsp. massiliense]SKM36135.1 Uncharacterised protein [Mycobacteroides abscessus subsp. massiliense]SKP10485.1 Uncharacterised protein [Mycobacteroides abscessus subsp. massiliense]SKP95715.1 Uncharacterised protein [Mycobacteroides abscessus subsp. massiliense]SLK58989.1 Uncharacterised protein [Mycobacteroides abscessus subsp. massiliense]
MITEDQVFTIDSATVKVWHDGADREPGESGFRQRYGYSITTPDWEYVSNDLRSGVGADADTEHLSRDLLGFLYACAESRKYFAEFGVGENVDLFPEHVGQWAESVSDELSILSADPEDA